MKKRCRLAAIVAIIQYLIMWVTHYEQTAFLRERPWESTVGRSMYFLLLIVLIIVWECIFYLFDKVLIKKNPFVGQGHLFGVYLCSAGRSGKGYG